MTENIGGDNNVNPAEQGAELNKEVPQEPATEPMNESVAGQPDTGATAPVPFASNPTERIDTAAPTGATDSADQGGNPTQPMHEWWNQRHEAQAQPGQTGQPAQPASAPPVPEQPAQGQHVRQDAQPTEQVPAPTSQTPPAQPEQPRYGAYAQPSASQPAPGQSVPNQQAPNQQAPGQPAPAPQYPGSGQPVQPGQQGPHHPYGAPNNGYPNALPPAVKARSKRSGRKVGIGMFAACVIAAALVGGGVAGGTSLILNGNGSNASNSSAQQAAPVIVNNTASVDTVTAVAAKAMPSVVTISATTSSEAGTGSGIILNTNGDILTNTHVVTLDGASSSAALEVQLSNGQAYPATVVGTDPLSDLAVVHISAPNLVPATLGDSSNINLGQPVVAIGAPLGLSGTVTDGIVSTVNRTIQVASSAVPSSSSDGSSSGGSSSNGGSGGFNFAPPDGSSGGSTSASTGEVNLNVIQTDAPINPGNSGGPLLNSSGQVIGINVAIASASSSSSSSDSQSGSIGVGFSIPVNTAKRISQELIANGKATHGQLGVSVQSAASGGDSNSGFTDGAQVAAVTSGSGAAKAGIKVGDVITKLGTRTITDGSSLTAAVREQAAGATVPVTLVRSGKTITVNVTLSAAAATN